MIAGLMVIGLGIAVLHASRLVPLYSAGVTMLIEGARQNVVDIKSVAQGITPDYYTNETQAAVIQSRDLIGKVVDRLDLYNDPNFNHDLAPPKASTLDVLKATVGGWFGVKVEDPDLKAVAELKSDDRWAGYSPEEKRAELREELIDAFWGGLTVRPSQRALLVEIEYSSPSPEMAAKAANATAEVYILDQIQSKGSVTEKATKWLAQRATELKQRVIDSEKKLEAFRRKSGIADLKGASLLQEQIAKINTDLVAARNQRSEAQARYAQVRQLLKSGGGIETAAAVLASPLIQRLREQETQVVRKLGELKTHLREAHPSLVLARNELKDLQDKISGEVKKIVVNLKNELQIARVREQNFKAELKRLESGIEKQNEAAVSIRALQTEVQANKQLYETIISRFKETAVVDDNLQQADAKVISRAVVPGSPYYPQKSVIYTIALFFAGAIGVALAIILELLDNGFRTTKQLEEMTGYPTLGSVPKLSRQDRHEYPHTVAAKKPNSQFGEAIGSVRTSLLLTGVEQVPKVVLVTSSVPSEGKTSISLCLGSMAARAGQRVIVVDCDLRRAGLHQTLGVSNDVGVSNYLSGQVELSEVIDMEPSTGLHFITAGARVPHPTDLLGSPQMYGLLQQLSSSYDLVVIDSPPLLAVSDALVLVREADRTIFVVRWQKTRRDFVSTSLRQLGESGARIAGLVMSQVDLKKQGNEGYTSGSGYYYGDTPKYYSD